MLSAVILDMDGLMLDTEPMSWRAWREAAAALGYELTDDIFDLMVGRPAPANARMLLQRFGSDFPIRELADSAMALYCAAIHIEGVPHKPGLVTFLRFLDEHRIPRAVATSTETDLARHKLERAGVLAHFDIIVGGDAVHHGKPAPDIFLEAARRLDHAPADCVVLEDSEAGVVGATRAGMRAILIPDLRPPSQQARAAAYRVLGSLEMASREIAGMMGLA
jgi:HAD superfamily hydrolase (TIGR01509 family)